MKQQLDLYRRLNTSLVPIQPDSKAYDKLAWQERGYRSLADLKRRGIRVSDLIEWFGSSTRKKRNCALVTTDHLLVVDFDNADTYWRFAGEYPIWANTLTVKSPHGYHCYFQTSETIPDIISAWSDTEIKHGGDCILCPPSRIGRHIYRQSGLISYPFVLRSALSLPMVKEREDSDTSFFTCANDNLPSLPIKRSEPQGERSDQLYRGIIQDIKSRLSMLELAWWYTELKPSGNGCFIGFCPAHDDARSSFRVVGNRCGCFKPDCRLYDKRALDIIEFHSRLFDLSYRESIIILAGELGLL